MFGIDDAVLATAGVGLLNYFGQQDTNAQNQRNAQAQMDFQERLSNSAYQRQAADMSAAGMNPMLSYMKTSGASTPVGASAVYSSPAAAGSSGAYTAAQTAYSRSQSNKTDVETHNLGFSAQEIQANTAVLNKTVEKMAAEIGVMQQTEQTQVEERKRIEAIVRNLAEETKLLKEKGRSEQQTTKILTETAKEAFNKRIISDADLKAMLDTQFIGRLAREIKPAADIASDLIGGLVGNIMKKYSVDKWTSPRSSTGTRYDKDGNPIGGYSSESSR